MEMIIFTIFVIMLMIKLNRQLIIENLVLRQQLAIMRQSIKRPRIRKRDRLFWILLSRFWNGWQDALIVVKPETVIRWHIEKGSSCIGHTNPGKEYLEDLRLILKYEN